MAMTKKEQEAMEALRNEVRQLKAWKLTDPVEPDVPIPNYYSQSLVSGFSFNSRTRCVMVSCSSSINHSLGRADRTTTQRPIEQYSTRERALRAMRYEMEQEFLKALADVDAQIEAEQNQ